MDPNSEDPIETVGQLIVMLGPDQMGTKVFETLLSHLAKKNAPETKLQEQMFGKFMKSIESQLVQPTELENGDPVGMRDLMDFYLDARLRWDAGLAAGTDPVDMVDSTNKDHYLGKTIPHFKTPIDEKSLMAVFLEDVKPRNKNKTPPKRPGETTTQWQKRTGRTGETQTQFAPTQRPGTP